MERAGEEREHSTSEVAGQPEFEIHTMPCCSASCADWLRQIMVVDRFQKSRPSVVVYLRITQIDSQSFPPPTSCGMLCMPFIFRESRFRKDA